MKEKIKWEFGSWDIEGRRNEDVKVYWMKRNIKKESSIYFSITFHIIYYIPLHFP